MPPSTSLLPKPVRLRESTTRPHHQPPQQSSNGATQQPAPPDSQQPAPVEDGAVATADLSGVCVACASFGRRFPLVLPRPLRLTPTIEKMIELSQKERERTDETRQAVHTVEQVRRQSLTHLYAGTRQTQSSEASLALRVRQLKAGIARLVQENASMREVWEEETENMEEWSTSAVKQAEEEVSQALHAKAAARQYAMADDLQHEREMNSLKAEIAQLTQSVGRGFNTSSVYGEYGRKAKEWGMRARMESFVADGVRIINMLEQDALPADVDARAITQEQLEQLLAKKYQEGLVSLQLQAAQASNQVKRMEEYYARLQSEGVDLEKRESEVQQKLAAQLSPPATDGATPSQMTQITKGGFTQLLYMLHLLDHFDDGGSCHRLECTNAASEAADQEALESAERALPPLDEEGELEQQEEAAEMQ